jgi:hypothetical protein
MNFVFAVIELEKWKAAALAMRRPLSALLLCFSLCLSIGKLNSDQSDKRGTSPLFM